MKKKALNLRALLFSAWVVLGRLKNLPDPEFFLKLLRFPTVLSIAYGYLRF